MSGFQVWNADGALTIDSDYRHTTLTGNIIRPSLIDVGAYGGSTPFGDWVELGYLPASAQPKANQLTWVRITTNNGWCFPGAWLFKPGTFQMATTSRLTALESGFLDVFDASGAMIWTAKSTKDTPRIRNLIKVSSAADNAVASVALDYSPWFLMSGLPGNISDDGTTIGYSGFLVRWTGTNFQYVWVRQNQSTYATIYGSRGGVAIALAEFPGR